MIDLVPRKDVLKRLKSDDPAREAIEALPAVTTVEEFNQLNRDYDALKEKYQRVRKGVKDDA